MPGNEKAPEVFEPPRLNKNLLKYYRSLSKLLMSFWSFKIPLAAKM